MAGNSEEREAQKAKPVQSWVYDRKTGEYGPAPKLEFEEVLCFRMSAEEEEAAHHPPDSELWA